MSSSDYINRFELLSECYIDDRSVTITKWISKKKFKDLIQFLISLGGTIDKEKNIINFDFDAKPLILQLISNYEENIKIYLEFNSIEVDEDLMISLLDIQPFDIVFNPYSCKGSILKKITSDFNKVVYFSEVNDAIANKLSKVKRSFFVSNLFIDHHDVITDIIPRKITKIISILPPVETAFELNIRQMYELLSIGGKMVIASEYIEEIPDIQFEIIKSTKQYSIISLNK